MGARWPRVVVCVGDDPRVLFADDFETCASAADLTDRSDDAYQPGELRIATEAANVYAGAQSSEMIGSSHNGGEILDARLHRRAGDASAPIRRARPAGGSTTSSPPRPTSAP